MADSGARECHGLEAFRVAQHGVPLARQRAAAALLGRAEASTEPDSGRAVLHFDVDAFYAQAEEVRNPSLRERPLGVTQKYLIVTANYPARRAGVTKLMGIAEARQKCPDLVLVSGEDLTPYREASRKIQAVLERYGTVERLGMDECFVDVTNEVQKRLGLEPDLRLRWSGHIFDPLAQLQQDNPHRPQDLRAVPPAGATSGDSRDLSKYQDEPWWRILSLGSIIAQEARQMVKLDAGFRSSCGVASNKMLAKLVSGLHKPDDQTIILPPDAERFMSTLPARAILGVGYKTSSMLQTKLGVESVQQLLEVSCQRLQAELGEAAGKWLWGAARGKDPGPVVAKGPPKSITVEDSFKDCSGTAAVHQVLAPDLLCRLQEDGAEYGRRAATLVVKWRHKGSGYHRASASCPMPLNVYSTKASPSEKAALLVSASAGVLKRNLSPGFNLSLINIGATNLRPAGHDCQTSGMLPIACLWGGKSPELTSSPEVNTGGRQCSAPPRSLSARAAADMATMQRRNYSSGNSLLAALGTMSKHQEREAREQRLHQPGSHLAGHQGLSWSPPATTCAPSSPGDVATDYPVLPRVPTAAEPPAAPKGARSDCPSQPASPRANAASGPLPGSRTIDHHPQCGRPTAAAACEGQQGEAAGSHGSVVDADRVLAMRLQQQEVDAFQRYSSSQRAANRNGSKPGPAGRGSRGKKRRGGPLDTFVTRQSQSPRPS